MEIKEQNCLVSVNFGHVLDEILGIRKYPQAGEIALEKENMLPIKEKLHTCVIFAENLYYGVYSRSMSSSLYCLESEWKKEY
jgi:hypothetical protein